MIEYVIIFLISLLPWIELRGSIPVGIIIFGLDPILVFLIALAANVGVIMPLFWFLDRAYKFLKRYALVQKTIDRARKKGEKSMAKYGIYGLAAFVALPLPFTGAWTGVLIAWVFNLDRKKAFASIAAGVVIAGVLVTLISVFAVETLYWLGAVPKA